MPGTVKVRVLAGRDLPVMDRSSETADAFVEIKFGQTIFKTEIYPKSLNPMWNTEWFTFEADDEELQDECVQFRVMDYDTYSANDAIGRVYLDLSPLLTKRDGSISQIGGWLPIYDTMHGIRGELNVCVKVNLFTDINRFRQSSCGVEVFSTPGVPSGYQLTTVHGFVEELIANSDPEYQWIDKIRTPRASNEARQALFAKLAGTLIRVIGRKVLEMGGNAVIGYKHCFDMEGGTGIVVRGVGTAVTLEKAEGYFVPGVLSPTSPVPDKLWQSPLPEIEETYVVSGADLDTSTSAAAVTKPITVDKLRTSNGSSASIEEASLNPTTVKFAVERQSPKGSFSGGLTTALPNHSFRKSSPFRQPLIVGPSMDFIEYPFITMHVFPYGFISSFGGVVCARSVKLLKTIEYPDEPETRDAWWLELRNEVRSHMKALGCNAIIGYQEHCSIFRDLCLLSAYGTASVFDSPSPNVPVSAPVDVDLAKIIEKDKSLRIDTNLANRFFSSRAISAPAPEGNTTTSPSSCYACHIPYLENCVPFPVKLATCQLCGNGRVPNILLTTVDPPPELAFNDDFQLIQARVVRAKQDLNNEALVKDISDMLPFVEHQMHTELVGKLRLMGKNAVFGLRMNLTIGESHLIAVATGTAVALNALVIPHVADLDEIHRQNVSKAFEHLSQLAVQRKQKANNEKTIDSKHMTPELYHNHSGFGADLRDSAGSTKRNLELAWDKDAIIVDMDGLDCVVNMDPKPIEGFSCSNLYTVPAVILKEVKNVFPLQMFVRVARYNINDDGQFTGKMLSNKINWLLKSSFYKFRKLKPFCLANVSFSLDLPQSDELQIAVMGMAMTGNIEYPHVAKISKEFQAANVNGSSGQARRVRQISGGSSSGVGDEVVFRLDTSTHSLDVHRDSLSASCPGSFFRKRRLSLAEETKATKSRQVFITPLINPSHSAISTYLGHYDFFFIRETTSLREAGGLDAFLHSAITEILYVVQAHVAAFGGQGMTCFQFTKVELLQNTSRNQAQCLIAVAGDIVTTTGTSAPSNLSV